MARDGTPPEGTAQNGRDQFRDKIKLTILTVESNKARGKGCLIA